MSADGHQKRARDFKTLAAIYEGKEGEKNALNADFYVSDWCTIWQIAIEVVRVFNKKSKLLTEE